MLFFCAFNIVLLRLEAYFYGNIFLTVVLFYTFSKAFVEIFCACFFNTLSFGAAFAVLLIYSLGFSKFLDKWTGTVLFYFINWQWSLMHSLIKHTP